MDAPAALRGALRGPADVPAVGGELGAEDAHRRAGHSPAQLLRALGEGGKVRTKVGGKPADLGRVVKILEDVNYRGWVALEYEDEEEPKVAVPRYLAELRKLVTRDSRS